MSVYIQHMNVPETCWMCYFKDPENAAMYCRFDYRLLEKGVITQEQRVIFTDKPDWCPITGGYHISWDRIQHIIDDQRIPEEKTEYDKGVNQACRNIYGWLLQYLYDNEERTEQ